MINCMSVLFSCAYLNITQWLLKFSVSSYILIALCVQTLIAPRPKVTGSPNFAYPQNPRPGICRYLAWNSTTFPSGGNSVSSRFNWRKVWTGLKCNFYSAQHHDQYVIGKLSIRRVRIWNFTMIGPKTKKLWLSIVPVQRPELQLFFAGIRQAVRR